MGRTDNTMDHRSRKKIYNYISANPGVAIAHLSKIFDLNYSTLKYHLKYLERNHVIRSSKEGRNRCFYINDKAGEDGLLEKTPNLYLLNNNQQAVLKIIQNNPGITRKKLTSFTKLKRKTLEYSVNKLFEMKLIWRLDRPEGECYEYITEEKLRYQILNQLLQKLLANEIDEDTFRALKRKLEGMNLEELRAEDKEGNK